VEIKTSRIFVAGHRGLVGSAVLANLKGKGCNNPLIRTRADLNLCDQSAVEAFFASERPAYVVMAAGRVGGIEANRLFQADFLAENLSMALNVISSAARHDVQRLIYLGSSCMYPSEAVQPITEESLLSGALESTNEGYAIAKIAGLKLCEKISQQHGKQFYSLIPCNLYGEGDNFHPDHSHVIPGLMRRFHEAKMNKADAVKVWGTGNARREFLHAADLAEAVVQCLEVPPADKVINVGTGIDLTIKDLASTIAQVVGYEGNIEFDPSMPDGMPRKVMDVSKILATGWAPKTPLAEGLSKTYLWTKENGIFNRS